MIFLHFYLLVFIYPPSCLIIFKRVPRLASPAPMEFASDQLFASVISVMLSRRPSRPRESRARSMAAARPHSRVYRFSPVATSKTPLEPLDSRARCSSLLTNAFPAAAWGQANGGGRRGYEHFDSVPFDYSRTRIGGSPRRRSALKGGSVPQIRNR